MIMRIYLLSCSRVREYGLGQQKVLGIKSTLDPSSIDFLLKQFCDINVVGDHKGWKVTSPDDHGRIFSQGNVDNIGEERSKVKEG